MDINWVLAKPIEKRDTSNVSSDNSLVGWRTMVAPINKTATAQGPSDKNTPPPGDVSELLGRAHAWAKVALSLHSIIKEVFQAKQVASEDVDTFLKGKKSLARYDSAFKLLWGSAKPEKLI